MKLLPVFLFSLLLACVPKHVRAQDDVYVLKAGMHLKELFSLNEIYKYPSFITGRVAFKNGGLGGGSMNYNRFSDEMEFIQGKDTMTLNDKETLSGVSLGEQAYYYVDKVGYVQRLAQTDYAKLAQHEYMRVVSRQREAANGLRSSQHVRNVYTGSQNNLVAREEITYKLTIEYFLGDSKANFIKADKKNVMKIYPEKSSKIAAYLKNNEVDFNNEESLKKLITDITAIR